MIVGAVCRKLEFQNKSRNRHETEPHSAAAVSPFFSRAPTHFSHDAPAVARPEAHLPSMARVALHQAVAVALTSASLLGAPTNLPQHRN